MTNVQCVLMLLWLLTALAGCGQRLPVAPASGVVLLDGAPLANASITTQPIAANSRNPGSGSFGRTDAEGRFELELVKPAMRGAIIGEHRVMIRPANGDKWPTTFIDGSLRIQVPNEGTKELRLELTKRMAGTK